MPSSADNLNIGERLRVLAEACRAACLTVPRGPLFTRSDRRIDVSTSLLRLGRGDRSVLLCSRGAGAKDQTQPPDPSVITPPMSMTSLPMSAMTNRLSGSTPTPGNK